MLTQTVVKRRARIATALIMLVVLLTIAAIVFTKCTAKEVEASYQPAYSYVYIYPYPANAHTRSYLSHRVRSICETYKYRILYRYPYGSDGRTTFYIHEPGVGQVKCLYRQSYADIYILYQEEIIWWLTKSWAVCKDFTCPEVGSYAWNLPWENGVWGFSD